MWQYLLRQFLQAVQLAARQGPGGIIFSTPVNRPEAYADRIKRDVGLHDYADAWSRYASDPAYWEKYYAPLPKPDAHQEILHDSVRAAGVPSRYNVFEYGYPESGAESASANSAPPDERSSDPDKVVNDRFGDWGVSPAADAPPVAPGPSDSFNDRFGKWGSAPADNLDNPRSPVLRELQKFRKSEVPEAPGPVASDRHNLDFDVSGLPLWMLNALAYRPRNESGVAAPSDKHAILAPDDPRKVRMLGARLARY